MTLLNNQITTLETQLKDALLEQEFCDLIGIPSNEYVTISDLEAQLETLYDESQAERRFEISSIYAS